MALLCREEELDWGDDVGLAMLGYVWSRFGVLVQERRGWILT